jgi:long-subunit acyl-CoA synthetase (AMP-forming)
MVGIGMTETAGAIFAGMAEDAFSGFSANGLIQDAQFLLVGTTDMNGNPSQSLSYSSINLILEGELVVKSKSLPHGYINYDDGSFSVDDQGWVTFKTGDRYRRTQDSKFVWLGRTTDFIQVGPSIATDSQTLTFF